MPKSLTKQAEEDARIIEKLLFDFYYTRLTELAVSRFKWNGLPQMDTSKNEPGVDEMFMEKTLFSNGAVAFFKDEILGYLSLPVAIAGNLNVYNISNQRRAYAANGYQRNLSEKDSVLIFNNYLRMPSVSDIEMYARRLANFDRAIDINVNAQKTPILLACDDKDKISYAQLYRSYNGNAPVIAGYKKDLSENALKVLKTDAPFVADKLYTLKEQVWNEAMAYLGIANTNVTKKERMVKDEVQRGMGGTLASRNSPLAMRQKACEEINKLFGLELSVEYREDFDEFATEIKNEVLGGEE